MDRIISDVYIKGEKKIWGDDPNTDFNQKILAINDLYSWLYKQGILEKSAFVFKDYLDMTFFAVDVQDLLPYRSQMESSGLEGADIAVQHIFDEEYTPCMYSGAITLGSWMKTYRDFDGTVESSWECSLVQSLNSPAALDVLETKETQGTRAALVQAYELAEFEPTEVVRDLAEDDLPQVALLDELSQNNVADTLDSEGYAWGVFLGGELVGYCTIGGADDPKCGYDRCPEWNYDSLVLSDVFVHPDYRGRGVATGLIKNALKQANPGNDPVFLTILDDRLEKLYANIGFRSLGNGTMVRMTPSPVPTLETLIQSASVRAPDIQSSAGRSFQAPSREISD